MAKRKKRLIDMSPEAAADCMIEQYGPNNAEREAARRHDDAKTEATASFYQYLGSVIPRRLYERKRENNPTDNPTDNPMAAKKKAKKATKKKAKKAAKRPKRSKAEIREAQEGAERAFPGEVGDIFSSWIGLDGNPDSALSEPETNPKKPKPLTVFPEHLEIVTDAGFTPAMGRREIRKLMETDAWHRTWLDNKDEITKTSREFIEFLHLLPYYKTDAERVEYYKKYDKPGLARYQALRKAAHASLEKMWKQRKKLVRALVKDMKKRKKNPMDNPADNPIRLPGKNEGQASFHAQDSDTYVHVWFDEGVASDDYGRHVPDSGEWQVIVTTSPDRLNQDPRGRELARRTFRFADPRYRDQVYSSAQTYVRSALFKYRNNPEPNPTDAPATATDLTNRLKF